MKRFEEQPAPSTLRNIRPNQNPIDRRDDYVSSHPSKNAALEKLSVYSSQNTKPAPAFSSSSHQYSKQLHSPPSSPTASHHSEGSDSPAVLSAPGKSSQDQAYAFASLVREDPLPTKSLISEEPTSDYSIAPSSRPHRWQLTRAKPTSRFALRMQKLTRHPLPFIVPPTVGIAQMKFEFVSTIHGKERKKKKKLRLAAEGPDPTDSHFSGRMQLKPTPGMGRRHPVSETSGSLLAGNALTYEQTALHPVETTDPYHALVEEYLAANASPQSHQGLPAGPPAANLPPAAPTAGENAPVTNESSLQRNDQPHIPSAVEPNAYPPYFSGSPALDDFSIHNVYPAISHHKESSSHIEAADPLIPSQSNANSTLRLGYLQAIDVSENTRRDSRRPLDDGDMNQLTPNAPSEPLNTTSVREEYNPSEVLASMANSDIAASLSSVGPRDAPHTPPSMLTPPPTQSQPPSWDYFLESNNPTSPSDHTRRRNSSPARADGADTSAADAKAPDSEPFISQLSDPAPALALDDSHNDVVGA